MIGAGGMGVVFRATQKGLDREVAVKMIRGGDLAPADDLRRFRLEAGASAQLDHPHIVPIYEVGEHLGYCFYVMKLIEEGAWRSGCTGGLRTARVLPPGWSPAWAPGGAPRASARCSASRPEALEYPDRRRGAWARRGFWPGQANGGTGRRDPERA